MLIEIHDVGHGACATITCPNGARILVDCGQSSRLGWYPSIAFDGVFTDLMVVQNLDEDHVKDLVHVWKNVPLGALYTNPTITANALASMKAGGGMGSGIAMMHRILDAYGSGLIGTEPDLGGVLMRCYHNRYGDDFDDTNNLSLATFVRLGAFTILFSGDLEAAGWRALLRLPSFVSILSSVNILLTSHHGRANGCCAEVFEVVRPQAVIFSDDAKQFETQEADAWYRRRVVGLPVIDAVPDAIAGFPRRHVLTTRRDGTISILVNQRGEFLVTPSRRTPAVAHSISESLRRFSSPVV